MTRTGRRATRGTPQEQLLRSLRARLLGGFVVVATLAVAAFGAVLVSWDARLASARLDSELRGAASRAAALVYLDDKGSTLVDGVADDEVAHGEFRIVVSALPTGETLLDTAPPGSDSAPLPTAQSAAAAVADTSESGTYAVLPTTGGSVRAALMPWFNDAGVAGWVMAVERGPRDHSSVLLWPTVIGGALLLLLLSLAGWFLTGRMLAPALRSAADRERFLATAAHELRTPLARLRGAATAIQQGQRAGSESARQASALAGEVDAASSVVDNLLLAARIDNARVDLRLEAVRLDTLAAEMELRVPELVVDVDAPVTVRGDPTLLRHALTNLVDNAIRHGQAGGSGIPVLLRVRARGGWASAEVIDAGPGFASTEPPRPYLSSGGGAGLGLPLVEWVARQHGGRVELAERADEPGAVARLVLPAIAA